MLSSCAGAAALLVSVYLHISLNELRHVLLTTTEQDLPTMDTEQCGDVEGTKFPNNLYGYGRLNIYRAYNK